MYVWPLGKYGLKIMKYQYAPIRIVKMKKKNVITPNIGKNSEKPDYLYSVSENGNVK